MSQPVYRTRVDSTRIRLNNAQILLEDFERREQGYISLQKWARFKVQQALLKAEVDRRRKDHFEAINEYHELVRRHEDAAKIYGTIPSQEVLRALLVEQQRRSAENQKAA